MKSKSSMKRINNMWVLLYCQCTAISRKCWCVKANCLWLKSATRHTQIVFETRTLKINFIFQYTNKKNYELNFCGHLKQVISPQKKDLKYYNPRWVLLLRNAFLSHYFFSRSQLQSSCGSMGTSIRRAFNPRNVCIDDLLPYLQMSKIPDMNHTLSPKFYQICNLYLCLAENDIFFPSESR